MPAMGLGLGIPFVRANLSSFVPTQRGDCLLWLRADRGITLAGSKVAGWANQQGNTSRDVLQSTDGSRPTFNATDAAYNNKSTLSFANPGFYLDSSSWSPSQSQAWTVYIVGEQTSAANATFFDRIAASYTGLFVNTTPRAYLYAGGSNVVSTTSPTTKRLFCVVGNGASSKIYVGSAVTPEATGNTGSNGLTSMRLGLQWNGGNNLVGKIAEVAAFSGEDDQPKREQFYAYASGLYGT